jgi:hypothetical protein
MRTGSDEEHRDTDGRTQGALSRVQALSGNRDTDRAAHRGCEDHHAAAGRTPQ